MTSICKSLLPMGTVIGLALTLSACASGDMASLDAPVPLTPTARYSLQVEPGLDRIALAVHDTGLSATQHRAINELVGRFTAAGAPNLVIEGPSGGDQAASAVVWATREKLVSAGVPADRIRVVSYNAPNPKAPVLAGFETIKAVVPKCGQAWGDLTRTADNQSSYNFGCAVTANLAAQVTNPRDLVTPRTQTPASAARRSVVFDAYAAGRPTSSAPEQRINGASISQAVE
jgi:pilus assembly protein CpaD